MTYLKKATYSILPALALSVACMATPDRALADQPFLGEIKPMGIINFCPRGWALADGQILAISSNTALFSLLGINYGGDGHTTFALPDLRGRVPKGVGTGADLSQVRLGQRGGGESVFLNQNQMAIHSHAVNATNRDGAWPGPGGKILAAAPPGGTGGETIYSTEMATRQMSAQMIAPTGLNQNVPVQDPSLVVRYCIATAGRFPSRS